MPTPITRAYAALCVVVALLATSCRPATPAAPPEPPPGWLVAGSATEAFRASLDRDIVRGGRASARLESRTADVDGFATIMQALSPQMYRGARVRFSGFVRTRDVTGWTGLWMRIDQSDGSLAFDNMQDRALFGTNDWIRREIVLDVADNATTLQLGLLQDGSGVSHLDDAELEIVGGDVPLTRPPAQPLPPRSFTLAELAADLTDPRRPRTLVNGGLEDMAEGPYDWPADLPPGWFMSGSAADEFAVSLDRHTRAAGATSARLALRPGVSASGYGTLMQAFPADRLRGKRMRMTALVKGEGITGRGDLWLRVQALYSPADGPGLGGGGCRLRESFEWRACEVVFDVVPGTVFDTLPGAVELQLGVGLAGPGTIWLDEVRLDEVTTDVPLTEPIRARTQPINLDFEMLGQAT